jgi:hypothetical protein
MSVFSIKHGSVSSISSSPLLSANPSENTFVFLPSTTPPTACYPTDLEPSEEHVWNKEHTHFLLKLASSPAFRHSYETSESLEQLTHDLFNDSRTLYAKEVIIAEVHRLKAVYPKAFMDPEEAFPLYVQEAIKNTSSRDILWDSESSYYLWTLGYVSQSNYHEVAALLSARFEKEFKTHQVTNKLCKLRMKVKALLEKEQKSTGCQRIFEKKHLYFLLELASTADFRHCCETAASIDRLAQALFNRYAVTYQQEALLTEVKKLKERYPKAFVDPEEAFPEQVKAIIRGISAHMSDLWNPESRYYAWILGHHEGYHDSKEIAEILSARFEKDFKGKQVTSCLLHLRDRLANTEYLQQPLSQYTSKDHSYGWNTQHTYFLLNIASKSAWRTLCLTEDTLSKIAKELHAKCAVHYTPDILSKEITRLRELYPKAFEDPKTAFPEQVQTTLKGISAHVPDLWDPESRYYLWILGHNNGGAHSKEIAEILSAKFEKKFSSPQVQSCLKYIKQKFTV